MAAGAPPLFGALIAAAHYSAAWTLCALFPLAAVPLVPISPENGGAASPRGRRAEQHDREHGADRTRNQQRQLPVGAP